MLEKHVYCVRCQAGKTVMERSPVMFRNGALAVKGNCPSCNGKVYKIVSKEELKAKAVESKVNLYIIAVTIFSVGIVVGLAVSAIM